VLSFQADFRFSFTVLASMILVDAGEGNFGCFREHLDFVNGLGINGMGINGLGITLIQGCD
jgi:hypothetical protein